LALYEYPHDGNLLYLPSIGIGGGVYKTC